MILWGGGAAVALAFAGAWVWAKGRRRRSICRCEERCFLNKEKARLQVGLSCLTNYRARCNIGAASHCKTAISPASDSILAIPACNSALTAMIAGTAAIQFCSKEVKIAG
jgi:hypothetical protein